MTSVKKYFHYNSFLKLLCKTKKYKELYCCTAGHASILLALISTFIFNLFYSLRYEEFLVVIPPLLLTLVSGFLGLLGFLITGLALLLGMVTNKIIYEFEKKEKVHNFVGILFSFYFEGVIIGVTLINLMLLYLIFYCLSPFIVEKYAFLIVSFVTSYSVSFSILYAIGLLGTSINMFFVNLSYNKTDMD